MHICMFLILIQAFHPPQRIVQDVKWVVNTWWVILKAQGVYVPGLLGGRIAGGRHVATIERNALHEGKRVRMEIKFGT